MPRLLIAAVALLLAGCGGAAPSTSAPQTSQKPAERPSDADLQARWWSWALSTPKERNPVTDPTGQFCARGQPKDIWFVAGTFGGKADRKCEVPPGRPLAGPAVNLYAADAADCEKFMATAKGSVTLDGQIVELRRVDPVGVTFDVAPGNVVGERAGRVAAKACGLWAWLPPLAEGEHELRIEGESGDFSTSAVYRLTIRAGD